MPSSGSTPLEQTEEGREFLQHRMAMFGLVGGAIGSFFLVVRFGFAVSIGAMRDEVVHLAFLFHFIAAGSFLVLWVVFRRGRYSARAIRAGEALALLGASVGYALMGYYLPQVVRPDTIVIAASTYGLVARAIYIPSTAKRTLAVCMDVAIPPLVVNYVHVTQIDVSLWVDLAPHYFEGLQAVDVANISTLFGVTWWICTAAVCAAASRVIYGLRKEVRDNRKLGQYTLDEQIGEGGMGVVYRAHHAMLRRPTAVKLVPLEKAGTRALARFEREVQLTAILTHPNTVRVFDYGRTPDGVFYYAMELLEGATLAEVSELCGPMPAARVISILTQTAGALHEAHSIGLIHRDIKPANIMLVEQGAEPDVVKVLDFGLVKELNPDAIDISHANILTGTPQYLSPEAIRAPGDIDGRSDLYALGAVGYFLLTGEHVFSGSSVVEVCGAHLHTEPIPPSKRLGREVPAGLEKIILSCLAKDVADRPAHAAALREQLSAVNLEVWTAAAARAWWSANAKSLESKRAKRTRTLSNATLDVELIQRTAS